MAREKGMGNLQREKSGRWTMRVGIGGKRYCLSTRTTDRDEAERILQRFLAPFGLGERRLPLAEVWQEYVKSPRRNELAKSTLDSKRNVWMHYPDRHLHGATSRGLLPARLVADQSGCGCDTARSAEDETPRAWQTRDDSTPCGTRSSRSRRTRAFPCRSCSRSSGIAPRR